MSSEVRPSQLMQKMTAGFSAPAQVDGERLERWQPFWENDTLPIARPKVTARVQDKDTASALWVENVLRSARDLLLASDLPCFAHFRLLRWARRETDASSNKIVLDAEFELPVFESYAPGTVGAAINEAITCVEFMMSHEPSSENREELWSRLMDGFKKRIALDNRINPASFRVLQAAYGKGIPFTHLGLSVYQLGWGSAARIISRSTGSKDPGFSARLTSYKQINAELLRRAGLPAPEHILVTNLEAARKAATKIGSPLVVKPADLDRGEGVAVDVQPEDLDEAVRKALELSPAKQVLVERQVPGVCYRIFVTHGRMLYAIIRNPMGVFGDGKQTVAELVSTELAAQTLKPKWIRKKILPLDDLARAAINAAGFSETSVPKDQQFVPLRRIESTAWGGTGDEMTDQIHPENVRIAVAATTLCGLNTAGVDIITDDITRPWSETGAIINEVNYSPALGGSEISRRHLPEYLDRVMQGSGLIPVTVFVGTDAAMDAAQEHLHTLRNQGVAGYLTNATETRDADGRILDLAVQGLYARARALVLDRNVEAMALVVQSDALLNGPLPLEGVDEVRFINDPDIPADGDEEDARRKALMELLSSWVWDRHQG